MFNFCWSAGLVNSNEPHLPHLSSQNNEMLIFGLCSTSVDQLGWSMEMNHICHTSPAKIMKCSFLDYVQLLMISWASWWTQTPKNEMLIFGLHSNSYDWLGRLMDSNPICHQSPAKKMKCFIFGLHSTSDDQPGWSMDLNPVLYHSPAKIMKCSFLDYVQLLMIGMVGWWIQTPSATSLQPKKWNAHFWIMFNFCWSAGLVNGNEPHLPHLSSQNNEMLIFGLHSTSYDWPGRLMDSNPICHQSPPKVMKCSFLDYIQLLIISLAGQWTWTTSTTSLQLKEWNTHFWITFKFLWLAGQVDGLKPHLPPVSSQKNEMLHFWITFKLLMINWDGQWIWIMSTTSL